jgi:MFS family permease
LLPIYSEHLGASDLMVGLIIASFSAMQFLFAPAWGRLSDRIGRRPVILIGNFGSAASYVLFGIASTITDPRLALVLLITSRVFAGVCGATLSVASAYIADISPPEKRSKSMGLIGMAFGLGFIFGPALGAVSIAWLGAPGPGWIGGAVCAANFVFGWMFLGESRHPGSASARTQTKLVQWGQTLRQPVVGLLILVYFLATFCFAAFESTFSRLVHRQHEDADRFIGYLFTYCGVLAAVLQGGLIGRMVRLFGEARLVAGSLLLFAIGLALLPVSLELGWLIFSLGLVAAGSGLNRPPTFGLISINTPPDQQGATLGVAQSAGSLARILAPIAANLLFRISPGTPYYACAAIAFLTGIVAWVRLSRASCAPADPTPVQSA